MIVLGSDDSRADTWSDELQKAKCVVVAGQGSEPSEDNEKYNEFWNSTNEGVLRYFSEEMQSQGIKTITKFIPIQSTDAAKNQRQVMTELVKNQCEWLIQLSVHLDRDRVIATDVFLSHATISQDQYTKAISLTVDAQPYQEKHVYEKLGKLTERDFLFDQIGHQYAKQFLTTRQP